MLVWLSRAPLPDLSRDTAVVERWHADGNPFVVCRQRGDDDHLSLGFCLATPGVRPRRIAVKARLEDILRAARPPLLEEVVASQSNPPAIVGAFVLLSHAVADAGLVVRVFGSWMWQALTGGLHVSDSSDLDVLVDVADADAAELATDILQRLAPDCPFKIDGELSLPGLGEVHWQEYRNGEPLILLKSINAIRMVRREDLWK